VEKAKTFDKVLGVEQLTCPFCQELLFLFSSIKVYQEVIINAMKELL